MSLSDDCASRLHEYCVPCSCDCHDLTISRDEAKALDRVLRNQWIDRDDPEAMSAVSKVCAFADSKAPIEERKPDGKG